MNVFIIGGTNLRWTEFLAKVLAAMRQPKRIVTVPTILARLYGLRERARLRRQGREAGLDPYFLMDILSRETFIDPAPAMQALGYEPDDIDGPLRQTIEACMPM